MLLGASRDQGQNCPFSDSPSKSRLGFCQPKELGLGDKGRHRSLLTQILATLKCTAGSVDSGAEDGKVVIITDGS